jgi:hypothetical protein
MEQPKAGTNRTFHNLPTYLLSDITFASYSPSLKIVNKFSCSILRTARILNNCLSGMASRISAFWRELAMAIAPLRKIVSRELEVYCPDPRNPKYKIYSLFDTLECGHGQEIYLYGGLQDLTFAYTDSPVIRAKRHRCRPCAQLLAKKPVQSVSLPAVAKTA